MKQIKFIKNLEKEGLSLREISRKQDMPFETVKNMPKKKI